VILTAPVWLLAGTKTGDITIAVTVTIVVILPFLDALSIPKAATVHVQRHFSPTIGVGDQETGTYQIDHTANRSLAVRIAHATPSAIAAPLSSELFHVAPHTTVTRSVPLEGQTRGVHLLGDIAITAYGILGLTKKVIIYSQNDTIMVIPSVAANRRFRLMAIQRQMRMAGAHAIRRRGQGRAFANLRDYVVGDDPRHIDWKASARRSRLITREYTIEQGQTVLIAIDAGRMMTQWAGDRTRFEYALASALTLADIALASGDYVGLLVFNEEVRAFIPPSRSSGTLTHIRDALTNVTVTLAEPDYAAAFRTIAERQKRRSLIVLFTDVIDMRSSRAIVANTARTALRHLPLVVALRNDQLTTASVPVSGESDTQAYQNIAAEELMSAREEVLQNMRQVGVSVLDTPPASLTAGVINRYLDIKNRSLL